MPDRVLIIDDDPLMCRLLTFRLSREPIELASATGGEAGLSKVQQFKPDLILLDIEMPDLDGFEVCRRLKENAATQLIPVIFLTSRTDPENKITGLDLGAVDYVTKPFDATELLARVRAALRTKRLLDTLESKAMLDGLTGLWNRTYFEDQLMRRIVHAQRHGETVACLLAGMDGFSRINELHGHLLGDRVLQSVGRHLQEVLRAGDVACRYGGDVFGMLLSRIDPEELPEVTHRIRQGIQSVGEGFDELADRLGVGVGTALYKPSDSDQRQSCQQLIQQTLDALAQAKQAGRNRTFCQ